MIVFIKPHLMESVVFDAVREDRLLAPNYQREFAACYDESDPEKREQAFRTLHERWFAALGFRARLIELLNEFTFVQSQVTRLVVSDVIGARRQGIELFGEPGRYNVVVSICPRFLLTDQDVKVWMRHELQHIDDMLDPAFGFSRSLVPNGKTSAARNLHRERYALLWAISIDARLHARGRGAPSAKHQRQVEFTRAFGSDHRPVASSAFERLWDEMGRDRPTHADLLERARTGFATLSSQSDGAIPGAACPLCKFTTFDWAQPQAVSADLAAVIRKDFADWAAGDGLCLRCMEVYRGRANRRLPLASEPGRPPLASEPGRPPLASEPGRLPLASEPGRPRPRLRKAGRIV